MDANEIRRWHDIFFPDGKMFEIRILGGKWQWQAASGYFKDVETMISQLQPILDDTGRNGNAQAFFCLNEINENLYSRVQHEQFVSKASTTKDEDIIRRRWVLIDFDPIRTKDVSSSEIEKEKAHKKAQDVYKFLRGLGFKEPVIALSGNGVHALYRVDMPNDEEHNSLVKTFVDSIARKFTDDAVDIDRKVFNLARICKLYGTEARKGANTPERPWRLARIIYPKEAKEIEANPDDVFKKAIDALPKEDKKERPETRRVYSSHEQFDLEHWLQEHGLEYRIKTENGIIKYQLRQCPWEGTHSSHHEWDSAVCKMPDGKITFTCFHAHCADKKWEDVRKLYEPDWVPYYERRYQQSGQTIVIQSPSRQKPKYQIKDEIPELGNKWMSMSSIKKVNISDLERVETGVKELDHDIMGLFMSEVSILSGTNGSGKSSFINTLILKVVNQGFKSALWSGELRADVLKSWIQMAACRKFQLFEPDKWGKFHVPDNIGNMIDSWLDGKFYLYNNEYGTKWEQVYHDMIELQKHGVKFFVLDNLTSLDIDFEGDKNDKQKKVIEDLKSFAKSNMVHIVLVAHPRKSMGRGMNSFIRKDDIAGSSDLMNLADDIFIIHRNNNDFKKGIKDFLGNNTEIGNDQDSHGNYIEVVKNRMFGIVDKMYGLYYEPETRRFNNAIDENYVYGWDVNAKVQEGQLFNQSDNTGLPFDEATDEAPF